MGKGRHKKRKSLPKIALAFLPIVIALSAGGYFIPKAAVADTPLVPEARSIATYENTDEDLCNKFDKLKIRCSVSWEINESLPVGHIVSQSPLPETRGNSVKLVYSSGPSVVKVPILAGLTKKDADKVLWAAGLKVGETETVDAPVPGNTVVSSSLAPSTAVAQGTLINLVYSTGQIKVPNWKDKPKELVEAEAKELGLTVKFTEQESTSTPGVVIQQDSADTVIDFDDSINIVLAKNSSSTSIPLPNVVGLTQAEAISLLASKGFIKITTIVKTSSNITQEKVVAMSPGANTEVNSASEVTITVERKS